MRQSISVVLCIAISSYLLLLVVAYFVGKNYPNGYMDAMDSIRVAKGVPALGDFKDREDEYWAELVPESP